MKAGWFLPALRGRRFLWWPRDDRLIGIAATGFLLAQFISHSRRPIAKPLMSSIGEGLPWVERAMVRPVSEVRVWMGRVITPPMSLTLMVTILRPALGAGKAWTQLNCLGSGLCWASVDWHSKTCHRFNPGCSTDSG